MHFSNFIMAIKVLCEGYYYKIKCFFVVEKSSQYQFKLMKYLVALTKLVETDYWGHVSI